VLGCYYVQKHDHFVRLARPSCSPHHHSHRNVIRFPSVLVATSHSRINVANSVRKNLAQQILVLESEDQRVKNNTLQKEIASLKAIYNTTLVQYEDILNLREQSASKTTVLENLLADILAAISKNDLKTAQDISKKLAAEITKEKSRLASLAQTAFVAIPASVPTKSYRRRFGRLPC